MNKRRLLREGILELEEEKKYSAREVYEGIATAITYVNGHIDGEFTLAYARKNQWLLRYDDEKIVKKRARENAEKQLKATADYIQQLTGQRPRWG